MKNQTRDWISMADKDLLTVSEILENEELTNISVFHSQQAIEKYFKALILENEKPPAKIHNLLALYGMVKEIKDLNLDMEVLTAINSVYIESRYPGELGMLPDGMPTIEQAKEFFEYAKEVKIVILNELS
jgi:HEPN domain-containing protein